MENLVKEERKESPINQWVRINKILNAYRYALMVTAALNVGFFLLCIYLVNRDTLVIGLANGEKLFFLGQRKTPEISESDVVAFSKQFIQARYSWNSYSLDGLLKELSPVTSPGLLQKIEDSLSKSKAMIMQNGFSQDAIVRNLKAEEGRVLAQVDRVIQLGEKMKIVSPMELTLTLIRGKPNRWNPLGLYVNSVAEHESE